MTLDMYCYFLEPLLKLCYNFFLTCDARLGDLKSGLNRESGKLFKKRWVILQKQTHD